jgi:putative SOS response-associated peptidase YedK
MQPTPAGSLVARRVGRAVNSNRADGQQLIEENAD